MKRAVLAFLPLFAALSACGQSSDGASGEMAAQTTVDIEEPGATDAAMSSELESEDGNSTAIPVNMPKIAYVYELGFRIAADRMPALQRSHADLCEKQGSENCRILDMRQSGSEGDYATGSLSLAVAAPRARAFGAELAKTAGEAGGKEVSSAISGEDLSKQIVDTEARLRARSLLRDRLMDILARRDGKVSELVEAERAVAQVNEEIDQARSWLTEMKTRVEFSRVNVSYASGSPSGGGFLEPIRAAVGSIGGILGMLFAAMIVFLTIAIPLGLAGWGLWTLVGRARLHGRQRAVKDDDAAS